MDSDEQRFTVDDIVEEFKRESVNCWLGSMNMPVAEEGYYSLLLQAIRAVYEADHHQEMTDVINWNGDEKAELTVCAIDLIEVPADNPTLLYEACPSWSSAMMGLVTVSNLRNLARGAREIFESEKERRGIAGSLRLTQGKLVWLAER